MGSVGGENEADVAPEVAPEVRFIPAARPQHEQHRHAKRSRQNLFQFTLRTFHFALPLPFSASRSFNSFRTSLGSGEPAKPRMTWPMKNPITLSFPPR